MSIFSRIFASPGPVITVSGEEARVVLNALRRSREAMPDMTETIRSRESRAKREGKIADRIGGMIQ